MPNMNQRKLMIITIENLPIKLQKLNKKTIRFTFNECLYLIRHG